MIESSPTMSEVQEASHAPAMNPEQGQPVALSLVIPVYNEVENLRPLVEEIQVALSNLRQPYEILFIDDGSRDGSTELLHELHDEYPQVGLIAFRRNFGQTAAFSAGFDYARGDVIVTMDADRQNAPEDIPGLVSELDEGYDVVNGWRQNRQDGLFLRRVPSFFANRLIAWSTGVNLHDRGCSLRAFRVEVVRDLRLYGEMHRFIPELASSAGFTMTEVAVQHRPRQAGQSKYGLSRTFRVILDLMTIMFLRRYSARPMHLFGGVGILSAAVGAVIGLYLTGLKIWAGIQGGIEGFRSERIGDRPLLMLSILLVILGIQFLVMGLLAELIVRTYHESQNKPVYFVREIVEPQTKQRVTV